VKRQVLLTDFSAYKKKVRKDGKAQQVLLSATPNSKANLKEGELPPFSRAAYQMPSIGSAFAIK
jgi:hypothetical protein